MGCRCIPKKLFLNNLVCNYRLILVFIFASGITCVSCDKDFDNREPLNDTGLLVIPVGFPDMAFPDDNPFTDASYQLGKKLFYDPLLSLDSSISCGSCHQPALAFSDKVAFTNGVNEAPGNRNVPSLTNVGYNPYFTREGGVPTLEMHVLVPIQEHNEFNFNIILIAERLAQIDEYITMCENAYGRSPDAFSITRSLANFQRTLISGNSAYDRYAFQGLASALNAVELRGMNLFFSDELACSSCHSGFNFSNYTFENNGLYDDYNDEGRMHLTGLEADRARFKVPSLRNVEFTAPYMFDGSLLSLHDVVEHYNSGGYAHINKSEKIRPLGLSPIEKDALVAFLVSLTDHAFLENPNHYPN